ncbi:uncharacterized protein JCM15063_001797 [Sporobolomyces koalae]|uniref:uncharacterized protein n=1 Tax=Sporobolomyces koalae TaxID=500713 RepID=UPI0031760446
MAPRNPWRLWEGTETGDCIKLIRHLESVSKTESIEVEAVFRGHVGVFLWGLSVEAAAKAQGDDAAVHELEFHNRAAWDSHYKRSKEPVHVVLIYREQEPETRKKKVLEFFEDCGDGIYLFGSTRFRMEIADSALLSTRLELPASFHTVARVVNVADPPRLLVDVVVALRKFWDNLDKQVKRKGLHSVTPATFDDLVPLRCPLLTLHELYLLLSPWQSRKDAPKWSQAPFAIKDAALAIPLILSDESEGSPYARMEVSLKHDLTFLERHEDHDFERRSIEMYVKAWKYFRLLFNNRYLHDAADRHHTLHWPTYPHNPFQPGPRSSDLSNSRSSGANRWFKLFG